MHLWISETRKTADVVKATVAALTASWASATATAAANAAVHLKKDVPELIADFYDFALFYFVLKGRRDYIFGVMHDCYENSDRFNSEEDFEKIRACEDENRPHFESIYMIDANRLSRPTSRASSTSHRYGPERPSSRGSSSQRSHRSFPEIAAETAEAVNTPVAEEFDISSSGGLLMRCKACNGVPH